MKKIIDSYFKFWNEKNLDGLKNIFTSDIRLTDWSLNEVGINNVLNANEATFKDVPEIRAEILRIHIIDNVAYCTLKIHLDKSEQNFINVIDIIEVSNNKINKIAAYKK